MDQNSAGMKDELSQCQLYGLPEILELFTLRDMPMQIIRRLLHYTMKRINYIKHLASEIHLFSSEKSHEGSSSTLPSLKSGDEIRVKSYEEIRATLNNWSMLKGCGFMEGMKGYCGTEQRVYKRVERFLDERDYRLKKSKGVVILEGVQCTGAMGFGRCDRSCYFFWREEWLEKVA